MSYCPKCHHEYAETVESCIDCGRRLRSGHRPVQRSLDLEDYVVAVGSLGCAMIAGLLLYVNYAAQSGRIQGPVAQAIVAGQPPFVSAIYVIVILVSSVVLAVWLLQIIVRRR